MKKNRYIIFYMILIALVLTPFKDLLKSDRNFANNAANPAAMNENAVIVEPREPKSAQNSENSEYYDKNDKNQNIVEKNGYYKSFDIAKNGKTAEYNEDFGIAKIDKTAEYSESFDILSQNPASADKRAKIDFMYNGKTFRYTDDLIAAPDHIIEESIYNRKINSPLNEKMRLAERCFNAGATYKDALLYVFPLLYKTVDKVKKFVDCDAVNSEIKFLPDQKPMFTITKEKNGYELIESRIYQDIFYSLKKTAEVKLTIVPKTLYPAVTAFDNVQSTYIRAKFSTDYSQSGLERKHNIQLALSKINGKVLLPGEEFSFNKTVGRRTEKNGFLTAKIIVKGEYVDGVGGGVCQASTTVYNCAVRADLEITQVKNHSLTSSYVPVSFDAMVNSGSSDLKFKNNSKNPVFIRAFGTETYAQVEIYGTALPYRISTESVIKSRGEAPPDKIIVDTEYKYVARDAEPGSKMRVNYSHGAVESEGYLIYHSLSGAFIEKKLIRKDNYSACEGIIAVAPQNPNYTSIVEPNQTA